MSDYSKGKIYTIRCRNDDTLIYVGSTIQPLSKRWGGHKKDSKIHSDRLLYSTIGDNWEDWFIELFENYPCENREQLCKREGEIIREIGATLNKNIAGRTYAEWRNDNQDAIKEYRNNNRDEIKKRDSEYRNNNRDEIIEKKREYYMKNKYVIIEKNKEYREKKKLEKQQLNI